MDEMTAWLLAAKSLVAAILAAFLGRIARHTQLVQRRLRKFWSLHLSLELVIAIFMGYVGAALAFYFELPAAVQPGFIAAISYLGPPILEKAAEKILDLKTSR